MQADMNIYAWKAHKLGHNDIARLFEREVKVGLTPIGRAMQTLLILRARNIATELSLMNVK